MVATTVTKSLWRRDDASRRTPATMIANDQRSASAIRARRRDCVHRGDPTLTLREGVSEGTRTRGRLDHNSKPPSLARSETTDFAGLSSGCVRYYWDTLVP